MPSDNNRFISMLMLCALTLSLLLNCSKSGEEEEMEVEIDNVVATVQIIGDEVFEYGFPSERLQLSAVARNAAFDELTVSQVTWTSSATDVAEIDQRGVIRPVSPGEVVISATIEGVTGTLDMQLKLRDRESFESGGTFVLKHVKLITMTDEAVLDDQTVIVKDGIIETFGPSATIEIPQIATEIDLTGKYLMPGMADMHTHLGTNVTESGAGYNEQLWDLTSKGQFLSLAANGVTTVLNCGDFGEPINRWADELAQNQYPGPALYTANWPRGPLDGHGAGRDLTSEQEAIDFVHSSQEAGYDFIKLYNQTPGFAIGPLIEEAAKVGMGTVGHFPVSATPATTLGEGLDLVAHTEAYFWSYFQFRMNDELIPGAISLTRANDTYVVTTLGVVKLISEVWCNNREAVLELYSNEWMDYVHETSVRIWNQGIQGPRWNPNGCSVGQRDPVYAFVKRYVKFFHEAGIPLVIGSDSPTVLGAAGFSMHQEFEILEEMGISNYEILKMATVNAGKFINKKLYEPLPFGKIEEGYRADLMVLDENPLEDFENLKRPYGVMPRGNWFTRDFFDRELEVLKEAYGN